MCDNSTSMGTGGGGELKGFLNPPPQFMLSISRGHNLYFGYVGIRRERALCFTHKARPHCIKIQDV